MEHRRQYPAPLKNNNTLATHLIFFNETPFITVPVTIPLIPVTVLAPRTKKAHQFSLADLHVPEGTLCAYLPVFGTEKTLTKLPGNLTNEVSHK